MSIHPTLTAALADQHRRDLVARVETHRIARAAHADRPAPARPMRIIPQLIAAARRPVTLLLALPLIVACIAATCSCSSNSGSAVGPPIPPVTTAATSPAADSGGTSTATGLFAYAPAGLQSSCTDTGGTTGHFPAQISGYTDSLACATGAVSEIDEVDYYQYASTSDMQSAYGTLDDTGGILSPGGCASGGQEYGTWSTGGAAIGDISCTIIFAMVWDDPNTNVLAVVKADYASPSESYDWWQSNGASIDGSSAVATSS
jgi:hypothetical protein